MIKAWATVDIAYNAETDYDVAHLSDKPRIERSILAGDNFISPVTQIQHNLTDPLEGAVQLRFYFKQPMAGVNYGVFLSITPNDSVGQTPPASVGTKAQEYVDIVYTVAPYKLHILVIE